jgi:hypothetical protein
VATTKKSATKKKADKKTEASPVGRPKNLVKLTAKDVPSGVCGMVEGLAHKMDLDSETVVTLALLHVYQQQRVSGLFGVQQLLERQKVYLG